MYHWLYKRSYRNYSAGVNVLNNDLVHVWIYVLDSAYFTIQEIAPTKLNLHYITVKCFP